MGKTSREQVKSMALKLFRSKGYHATSMRDIAAALQVEASSLYNHIDSKEALLHATCFEMADRFITALDEVNDIYFNASEKIRVAIRNHIQILADNLDAAHVFLYEWKHLSEPQLSDFKLLRDRYEAGYRIMVQQGEQEGVFEERDSKFAVLTILSSINWIVEWYKPEGKMKPHQIADKLTDFILNGLAKEKIIINI